MKKTAGSPKKARISIALDQELLTWVDEITKKGSFANRSRAIHIALLRLKKDLSKEEGSSRNRTRISTAMDQEFLAWIDDFLWKCNSYPV